MPLQSLMRQGGESTVWEKMTVGQRRPSPGNKFLGASQSSGNREAAHSVTLKFSCVRQLARFTGV